MIIVGMPRRGWLKVFKNPADAQAPHQAEATGLAAHSLELFACRYAPMAAQHSAHPHHALLHISTWVQAADEPLWRHQRRAVTTCGLRWPHIRLYPQHHRRTPIPSRVYPRTVGWPGCRLQSRKYRQAGPNTARAVDRHSRHARDLRCHSVRSEVQQTLRSL